MGWNGESWTMDVLESTEALTRWLHKQYWFTVSNRISWWKHFLEKCYLGNNILSKIWMLQLYFQISCNTCLLQQDLRILHTPQLFKKIYPWQMLPKVSGRLCRIKTELSKPTNIFTGLCGIQMHFLNVLVQCMPWWETNSVYGTYRHLHKPFSPRKIYLLNLYITMGFCGMQ